MYDIAVIGAGASGVMAALKAKNNTNKIVLLEQNEKILKKILVTGNGRCNLTNKNIDISSYHSSNLSLVKEIINTIDSKKIINYFNSIGLITKYEDGLVYPYSNYASTVVDSLILELSKKEIEIITDYEVINIEKINNYFEIENKQKEKIKAKYIILSTGGKSYYKDKVPVTGYKLLEIFNHNIMPTFPSLVRLKTNHNDMYRLKGMKIKACASVYINNKLMNSEIGEVLFGDGTLSGICIYNLSYYVNKHHKEDINISLDIMPEYSVNEIKEFIINKKDNSLIDAISYFFHKKIARSIIIDSKLNPENLITNITGEEINKLIKTIKSWNFTITGTDDFKASQVTSGGLDLNEFTRNLESKKIDNLFVTGEVLDVDAICGGFNLQWAFSSGYVVGEKLNKLTNKKENI
jgi:flavoprotein, HI0933 family